MWLEKIDIQHFRNYTEASVSFSPHLNIFLGRNAQGKTNILEAFKPEEYFVFSWLGITT